ncbi:MAG: YcxB family protein [Burkholderiales bacterium]
MASPAPAVAHEATLVFSEALLRSAVVAFWRRSIGAGFAVALVVMTACLAFLLATGDRSWLVGALGTVLALALVFVVALYVVQYRGTMRRFRAMGRPTAVFRADDASFSIASDVGTGTYPWSVVRELWRFRDVWLLLYSPAQFSTLPVACLPSDLQAYVVQRVRAAGGKVAGEPQSAR